MSYCRWSNDDFSCDLYCYEDVSGGWTTHVAGRRIEWTPPEGGTLFDMPKVDDKAAFDVWVAKYKARHEALNAAPTHPIGGPFDGETFNDPTLEDFKARLLSLRAAGYQFSEYVIDAVDEEIAEAALSQTPKDG